MLEFAEKTIKPLVNLATPWEMFEDAPARSKTTRQAGKESLEDARQERAVGLVLFCTFTQAEVNT